MKKWCCVKSVAMCASCTLTELLLEERVQYLVDHQVTICLTLEFHETAYLYLSRRDQNTNLSWAVFVSGRVVVIGKLRLWDANRVFCSWWKTSLKASEQRSLTFKDVIVKNLLSCVPHINWIVRLLEEQFHYLAVDQVTIRLNGAVRWCKIVWSIGGFSNIVTSPFFCWSAVLWTDSAACGFLTSVHYCF